MWQKKERDELREWYEEKVSQGIIESDEDGSPERNWSVRRHLVCLKT